MTFATASSPDLNSPVTESSTWLVIAGVLQVASCALASHWIDEKPEFMTYLLCFWGWNVIYLASCYLTAARRPGARSVLWLVIAVAIATRAIMLPTDPSLSDDLFRYRWDGRVQLDGTNPYLYAPGSTELRHLRDGYFAAINNKDISTIYPPLMQHVFHVAAVLGVGLTGLKAIFVSFDLVLIAAIAALLRYRRMNPSRVLIYAWNPLVITEIAGSGHNDVVAVLLMIVAQWAIIRKRALVAMVLLGLSGAAKIVGFFLAPLFWHRVRLRDYAALLIATILVSLPFVTAGNAMFEGLTQYATRWRANDSLFHVLYWLTGSLAWPKVIAGAFLVALSVWLVVRRIEPLRSTYWVIGAILLLTSTLHPWYLLWIIPFLCFYPSAMWLGLSATVALAYHAPFISTPGEPWQEWVWIKWLEYAPLLCIGAIGWLRRALPANVETGEPAPDE